MFSIRLPWRLGRSKANFRRHFTHLLFPFRCSTYDPVRPIISQPQFPLQNLITCSTGPTLHGYGPRFCAACCVSSFHHPCRTKFQRLLTQSKHDECFHGIDLGFDQTIMASEAGKVRKRMRKPKVEVSSFEGGNITFHITTEAKANIWA